MWASRNFEQKFSRLLYSESENLKFKWKNQKHSTKKILTNIFSSKQLISPNGKYVISFKKGYLYENYLAFYANHI